MLERYYNLFDATQGYTELLFRAGDGLQSRELNEIQSTFNHRLRGVADALLKDGDIVEGGAVSVDPDSGAVTLATGLIYLQGMVRSVPEETFTIPTTGRVAIGVRLSSRAVTELEDPALREPAVGVRNYQEPGAGRLEQTITWAWEGDGVNDGGTGQFHAVYSVDNGILENRTQPPALDGVIASLAKYDYDSNGHYVVDGLNTRFIELDSGTDEHVFTVSEGRANVNGFKIERPYAQRLRLPVDPDLRRVNSEPEVFTDSGDGSMVVTLNRAPLAAVVDVRVTKEKTESVTHGLFTGATDTLAEPTVVQVVSVTQGGTTYSEGTDYTVSGGDIDWSPGGAEPAPGSSYDVVYQYVDSLTPTSLTDTGFTVSGVVNGTTMYIDYDWKLPRIDVLTLNKDGALETMKGLPQTRNPVAPRVPASRLEIAQIDYDWFSTSEPKVNNTAVRTIRVDELTAMRNQIGDLYDLMALQELRVDANIREPAAKKGLFVDNFLDDDLRDQGAAQTAAIVDGLLMLPIDATIETLSLPARLPETLPFTLTPIVEQVKRTGSMLVNPYQAFEPLPAVVTLDPAVDRWTITNTTWASQITRTIWNTWRGAGTRTETLARTETAVEFLRQITVDYDVTGFGPSEALAALTFDGISIDPAGATANALGELTGSFTIPANVPSGTKEVTFLGAGGSFGTASFTGAGTIVAQTLRNIVTRVRWNVDPLAQTFVLPSARILGGVDLWFTAVGGDSPVVVQIRETQVGMPVGGPLTESWIESADILTNGNPTRIEFPPIALEAEREYALVVLTDDPAHACAIAELGKYDTNSGWVTAQPYQIGVLLSSSNASTWTPHQDRDLAFRLLSCDYSATERTIELGTLTVSDATELLTFAGVERTGAGADVEFELEDDSGEVYRTGEGQALALTTAYTGDLAVRAILRGTSQSSPILWPDMQVILGTLDDIADYVTRAIPADTTFDLTVVFEALTPGSSSVTVEAESASANNFVTVPFQEAVQVGDNWTERTYKAAGLSGVGLDLLTRVRLTLAGSPAHRPLVRKLRVVVT